MSMRLLNGSMASLKALIDFSRPTRPQVGFNGPICRICRGLATAAPAVSPTLPLAGIRVLDMTRVLAGVGQVPQL